MAKLTQEDWAVIKELGDRMDAIFRSATPLACTHGELRRVNMIQYRKQGMGDLLIPDCCFPGMDGYDEIIAIRREIKRIKDGRTTNEEA